MKRSLFIIVLIALIIRLLFFNGLNWEDDPDYVYRAYQVKTGQQFINPYINGFRVGVYYPAAITYALFGVNDFGCGSYALIVSLLSIVVIFYLGRLLFNETVGLTAALLLAFYPLDIEYASRLMPDGLLAGFSLFMMYFLYKGDLENIDSNSNSLKSARSYIYCGLLFSWCYLINMSSIVLAVYLIAYFLFSIFLFKNKFRVLIARYAIIFGIFLTLFLLEGLVYYKATGDFLFKYHYTFNFYATFSCFCRELWLFPRVMFKYFGPEQTFYGFYYFAAAIALVYSLFFKRAYFVCLWLIVIFAYLEWGSMSFTHYNLMHRLPRHMSLATPPMILCVAFFICNIKPLWVRRFISPLIVAFLIITSLVFCYYRHQDLNDWVLPQAVVHSYLETYKPQKVYALGGTTIAYQRFLDKFQDKQRQYLDIEQVKNNPPKGACVILGEYRIWEECVRRILPNPHNVPANWKLEKTISINGVFKYNIKFYKII